MKDPFCDLQSPSSHRRALFLFLMRVIFSDDYNKTVVSCYVSRDLSQGCPLLYAYCIITFDVLAICVVYSFPLLQIKGL